MLSEGVIRGRILSHIRIWHDLRAWEKVQVVVVSNGMWLLYTVLRRDKRVGGGAIEMRKETGK